MKKSLKAITVFCGSKTGNDDSFIIHAKDLGKILAENKIKLIYGAGSVGLMGALADSCLQNDGEVVGIIPELLVEWEQQHNNLTQLIVTKDMHQRKKLLYEFGDAAIVLAGGYGTLDELFEIITWNNLKIHEKKIYIINTNQFYTNLLNHITQMQKQGFLYENWESRITVVESPNELLPYLK